MNDQGTGVHPFFPPEIVVEIKALACQLPKDLGLPFSRFGRRQIAEEAIHRGIVASISGATVWRWLHADAIRPWCYRSWIWPRDPHFEEKAGRVLDLYHGTWEGERLGPDDYVMCADEKTSIQARKRVMPTVPPISGYAGRVEHEYERCGAFAYVAAWDVRRAKIFGLCRKKTGIESFHNLVDMVMSEEPYRSARRVFWITDNGSSHRGQPAIKRLLKWYQNAILVHTPIHASWLNQVEIYFSVVQRRVLTPNDFQNLNEVESRLLSFQNCYEKTANPFAWEFTREDLKRLLERLSIYDEQRKKAA
jgi:transposase